MYMCVRRLVCARLFGVSRACDMSIGSVAYAGSDLFLGLLRACELLEPDHLVVMLKAVKHLSMNPTLLEALQNANAIEIVVRILDEQSGGPHSTVS